MTTAMTLSDLRAEQAAAAKLRAERVVRLRLLFDGAIRYNEMLIDNPDWSDDECLRFAREWHATAVKQAKETPASWNEGIPYCRNDITKANLGL